MTTTTLTLAQFLEARIAEDETVARAAGVGGWVVSCGFADWWGDEDDRAEHLAGASHAAECSIDGPDIHIYDEGGHDSGQAHHIARHDPARVLAECAAKRAIIKFHESWPVLVETPPTFEPADSSDINTMTYRATQQIMWATEQEYRSRFGSEPPTAPMLRALASVCASHEDFNPDWAS